MEDGPMSEDTVFQEGQKSENSMDGEYAKLKQFIEKGVSMSSPSQSRCKMAATNVPKLTLYPKKSNESAGSGSSPDGTSPYNNGDMMLDEGFCDCDTCLLGFDDTQPDGEAKPKLNRSAVKHLFVICIIMIHYGLCVSR